MFVKWGKGYAKRFFAFLLCAACLTGSVSALGSDLSVVKPGTYSAYVSGLEEKEENHPLTEINVNPLSAAAESGLPTENVLDTDAVVLKNDGDILNVSFNTEEAGYYYIAFNYCALPANECDIEVSVSIDGQQPFDAMKQLKLPRLFTVPEETYTEFEKDNQGNDLRPTQIEEQKWIEKALMDTEGSVGEPYSFYLTEGIHTLSVTLQKEAFAVSNIKIYNLAENEKYTAPANIENIDAEPIIIEAEHVKYTTTTQLYPVSDKTSCNTTPSDPVNTRLNAIGGENWVYPYQSATWEFTVEKAGYYAIGARYLQNFKRGMSVSRTIKVDGKIPFAEFEVQDFDYSVSWQNIIFGDDEPYYIWLDEGVHTVEMDVTTASIADIVTELDDAVYALNSVYRSIIMITGTSPDIYRDYYLDETIPGLMESLATVSDELKNIEKLIDERIGQAGSEAAVLGEIYYQLDGFIAEPNTIPSRLTTFSSNISSLATWALSVREQPLQLDKIYVLGYGSEIPADKYGFFGKIGYSLKSFFASFSSEYSSVGNVYDEEESITVWTTASREKSEVLKKMIDREFTPESNIYVNFSIVQSSSSLMQAIMAGKGPDVAVSVGRGDPINMALREAILPLDEFDGFDDVAASYGEYDLLPYQLDGKTYGLAETKTFFTMFYRKDIFDQLGIEPPETWDDLYYVAEVLQRNNMNVGLPYTKMSAYSVVTSGLGSQSIFPTLLLQKGVKFYNSTLTGTNLSTDEGYQTFKTWCEFYTLYGFPVEKNDYNRFRTGEMPLVISNYTLYNELYAAAPEIRGLWEMIEIPGTVSEDGSVNRDMVGSGTACIMIRGAKNKESAWEFMKWWTDAETQGNYGKEIENILGTAGRYNPCKTEALSMLAWSGKEQKLLVSQLENVKELEEIPGGYYASRNVDNAFRQVVYNNKNIRESLNYWNSKTNDEIVRKREEFGLN